jgi:hypothetical protein
VRCGWPRQSIASDVTAARSRDEHARGPKPFHQLRCWRWISVTVVESIARMNRAITAAAAAVMAFSVVVILFSF